MSISFSCPSCGKQLVTKASLAGQQRSCPQCGTVVTVPAASESASPKSTRRKVADPPAVIAASGTKHPEDLIDMTAMVDIVFFLLIFFMVTSIQALQSVIDLPRPQAPGSTTAATTEPDYANDPTFIIVTIEADDTIWVEDDHVFTGQELRAKLRQLRKKDMPPTGMLVMGNPEASHGTLVMVLDAGADVGMEDLRFSVSDDLEIPAG